MNETRTPKLALAALIMLLTSSASFADPIADATPFYVGSNPYGGNGKGIFLGRLSIVDGQLSPLKLVAEVPTPGFLALSPNHRFLYAALAKGAANRLVAFKIEDDGSLQEINGVPFKSGYSADHISVDATGQHLLAASWKGVVAVFPINSDGSLGNEGSTYAFSGSGPAKYQESAHCHSIYTDLTNRFAYVCDLGSDVIGVFHFDATTGALLPITPFPHVPSGSGPRHLAFSADDKNVYVNNQMGLSVSVFSRNLSTGRLTLVQTAPTLPSSAHPPQTTDTSEILFHPSGKWLYVGNRRYNSITTFEVKPDGTLALTENHPLNLRDPVNFVIDSSGKWMIVAGQDDTQITVLQIDPASGKLQVTGHQASVVGPSCIVLVDQ